MANEQRGETELIVNGTPYTLKLSMNAAAVTQKRHEGKTLGTLLKEAGALDVVAIRALAWLLLQKHHARTIKTEDDAGNLIDDAGVAVFFEAVTRLAELNNEGLTDPNPTAQETGTGETSTLELVASA